MKRLLSLTAFLLLTLSSFAHDFEVDGIYYNKIKYSSSNEVAVTYKGSYYDNEYSGSVVIPSSVTYNGTTYSVTSIDGSAFRSCTGLTDVTIPNSVTNIGDHAFSSSYGLTSITIPNSVTTIGSFAFHSCTGLTSITIGNSVTSIGADTFQGCIALANIVVSSGNTHYDSRDNCNAIIRTNDNTLIFGCKNTVIPNSVTTIGSNAFHSCTGLTSITIPNSVTSIGSWAFSGCSLTSVTIPNSVTSIGYRAFSGCTRLASIIIPNSVTSIGSEAFFDCTRLASITIPNSVTTIGSWAFLGCTRLTDIVVSNANARILKNAFQDCTSLTSATLGNIEDNCDLFKGCNALTNVTILNGATKIGGSAFQNCIGLEQITIPNTVKTIGYHAFNGCTKLKNISIPNSVTKVGNDAFSGCTNLKSIVIPNSITEITSSLFGNSGLESIVLPPSIRVIGNDAFMGCTNLKKVRIPSGVETIGWRAFRNCSALTTVVIPNSVTDIGGGAFENCMSLTSINALMNIPKELDESVFGCDVSGYNQYTIYYIANLYVPRGRTAIYQNIAGWKLFSSITEKDIAYELVYVLDGEVYKSYEIQAGMTVTPEGYPVKDGYVFSGWDTVPETMPEHDVIVYGHFEPYTDLTPMTAAEERSFGEDLTGEMDLSGVVINNVYYNVDGTDGSGYDSASGSIVLNTAMSDGEVDALVGKDLGDTDVRNGFDGIIFEVPAGSGKISVDVKTMGSYALCVKVGGQEPRRITQIERGTVTVSYTVSEPTLVYIYATPADASASNVGMFRAQAAANSVQLFGFKWEASTNGIATVGNAPSAAARQGVYTLTGMKVGETADDLKALPKGIYIVNGRKVAVK